MYKQTLRIALNQIEEWRDLANEMGGLDNRIQMNSDGVEAIIKKVLG